MPSQAGAKKPVRFAKENRESSTKRGYGYKWQKAREGFLRSHPLCADHMRMGKVVQATIVDHIKAHRGDMELFWDKSNWQSLCESCHNIHKQRLEKSGKVQGCDLLGVPGDPNHHWHRSDTPGGGSKV